MAKDASKSDAGSSADVHELLRKLKLNALNIIRNRISLSEEAAKADVYDYQDRLKRYLVNAYHGIIGQLSSTKDVRIGKLLERIRDRVEQQDIDEIDALIKEHSSGDEPSAGRYEMDISLDYEKIPAAIRNEIRLDCQEIMRCFASGCFRSAIILCGRVIEVALHRKYYEATKNDLLEKSPGIGLGKIIAKLNDEKIDLGPGVSQQIHLINSIRISSVHTKKEVFIPKKNQTHAVILFTFDLVGRMF